MKGFNFKLENILKVKTLREDLAKAELANLQTQYKNEENNLYNMQNCYLNYQNQLIEKQQGQITIQEISLYKSYFNKAANEISKQQVLLIDLEGQVNKQREKLVDSIKERKILENLRQKKYQEYRKIVLGKEQNFLDEIATNNFIRPKG